MKSLTEFTLSSVHGTKVGVLCIEAVQDVSCLFEVVDVLKGPECDIMLSKTDE